MKDSVGFIGLGEMGSRMVARLLSGGYKVLAFDLNPERRNSCGELGAVITNSIKDVADSVATVLVSLPTSESVESVAFGPGGLVEGKEIRTYIDMSTSGPLAARNVERALREKGVSVLDAPVSGGIGGASTGSLTIMVSGSKETLDENKPLLERLGKRVVYVGPVPGQAQIVKVLNNMLEATSLAITSEVMVAGVKAGISAPLMIEIFNGSSGRNSATEEVFPNSVLPRSFDEGFALGLAHKDIKLCISVGHELGIPMWIGSIVDQLFTCALAENGFASDFSNLVGVYERWANVQVEG